MKKNLVFNTLKRNIEINEKTTLLNLEQYKHFLKIVVDHLGGVLERLNKQKEIVLNQICPALANGAISRAGLITLRDRMEELKDYIESCHVNGKKTVVFYKDLKRANTVIFPMTCGVAFGSEISKDLNSQNIVYEPVCVGFKELGILSLYKKLLFANEECDETSDSKSLDSSEQTESSYYTSSRSSKSSKSSKSYSSSYSTSSTHSSATDGDEYIEVIEDDEDQMDYTRSIYIYKYKFEEAIEKLVATCGALQKQLEIVEMREEFVKEDAANKIAMTKLFCD